MKSAPDKTGSGTSRQPATHGQTSVVLGANPVLRGSKQHRSAISIGADTAEKLRKCLSKRGLFDDGCALIHVQIEHGGRLVLGAYDHFHKDCVVAYEPAPESLLERLRAVGVIRSYEVAIE